MKVFSLDKSLNKNIIISLFSLIAFIFVVFILMIAFRQYQLHKATPGALKEQVKALDKKEKKSTNANYTNGKYKNVKKLFGIKKTMTATAKKLKNVTLMGIIVTTQEKKTILKVDSIQGVYALGSKVNDDLIIYRIEDDKILLMRNGELIELVLDENQLIPQKKNSIAIYEFGFNDGDTQAAKSLRTRKSSRSTRYKPGGFGIDFMNPEKLEQLKKRFQKEGGMKFPFRGGF